MDFSQYIPDPKVLLRAASQKNGLLRFFILYFFHGSLFTLISSLLDFHSLDPIIGFTFSIFGMVFIFVHSLVSYRVLFPELSEKSKIKPNLSLIWSNLMFAQICFLVIFLKCLSIHYDLFGILFSSSLSSLFAVMVYLYLKKILDNSKGQIK
ncbi:hypothetical protein [Acinetobacter sp. P1(2025)]|uniref:hypothetical protein n=1 Tax=Acinetobacter sp. P1(2025) TaxID=3446120 RepID=UPI003F53589A